jgi:hypothetical protein
VRARRGNHTDSSANGDTLPGSYPVTFTDSDAGADTDTHADAYAHADTQLRADGPFPR